MVEQASHTARIADLLAHVEAACDRLDALDPQIQAFVPEAGRRERLRQQALELQSRYPDPAQRPPLYGMLVGVKDVFRVDGLPTRAGSQLPPEVLAGAEASSVTRLRENGALIPGKTVTAEFAYFEPGPTHNPRNLAHTPGGSSSGSAAAVAAGFCPLALGTQTIGSVLRPAAYCGLVGFKPSYGRIPTDGVFPVSQTLDHVGLFAQDVAGIERAASLLCPDWRTLPETDSALPVLGVPVGAYLELASPEAREIFDANVKALGNAGYRIQRMPVLDDFQTIREQTFQLMSAEMADAHAAYFAQFEALYRPRTHQFIRNGQQVTAEQRQSALAMQKATRDALTVMMAAEGIDLWITPAATSAAPLGHSSTGDPAMSLPWTLIGFPAISLPVPQQSANGLPFGLQCAAGFMDDERLLRWSARLADVFAQEVSHL